MIMAPNLDVLLKPFKQIGSPEALKNLTEKFLAIEQQYKDIFNLSLPLDKSHK